MKACRSSILYFPEPARKTGDAFPPCPHRAFPRPHIAPGFIDLHIHFPQTDVIGSPADGLLPWLENCNFLYEKGSLRMTRLRKQLRFS